MRIDFKNKVIKGSTGRNTVYDCQIPENAKAVIVFVHGHKGYKDWGAWQLMQEWFVAEAYGFLKFNMSHNGGTVNNPIDFPDLEAFGKNKYSYEVNDLTLIIEELDRIIRQELEADLPIYMIGHSRGGGVGILASSGNAKVKKLVTLAGISDIFLRFPTGKDLIDWKNEGVKFTENKRTQQQMPHFYSLYEDYLANKEKLDIQLATEKLSIPFLVVHGDMDVVVSISEGQLLGKWSAQNNKAERIAIVKGAGHTFGATHPWTAKELPEDLEKACTAVLTFFNK